MSIKLMALAWELDIPSTEKMVLLSLCDYANGDGKCWPGAEGIGKRCSLSERTVRKAIKWLEDARVIQIEKREGRASLYTVDPGSYCTPENAAPRNMSPPPRKVTAETPEAASAEPIRTIKEPSSELIARKPDDLDAQVWADWKRVRKKPITPTVMVGIEREAAKLGWSVSKAITHAAESSWQGFKASWVKDEQNGGSIRQGGSSGADRRSGLARAIDGELRLVSAFP